MTKKSIIYRFNPKLKILVKSLEFIQANEPCLISKIPLCNHAKFKWLWGMRDKLECLRIEKSKKDGRSHIAWLTPKGIELLKTLKDLSTCEEIYCKVCHTEIDNFFKIPNKRWKRVTGKLRNEIVCRKCFNKMEGVAC